MERLLPDVDYHFYAHKPNYTLAGGSYSTGGVPGLVNVVKQEMGITTQQPNNTHQFTKSIMHASCENQHVSVGIDSSHPMSVHPTNLALPASAEEVEQNTLIKANQYSFIAYNASQNAGNAGQGHPFSQHYYPTTNLHYSAPETLEVSRSYSIGKTSRSAPRYCGVCGDVAKSYHFGGLSCDSCKAFFRRSVHNDNYMHFQCYHNGQCMVTITNRKSCQYCRMKRCFAIGMEKSWVMTEEERKALMKTRAENKMKKQLAAAASLTGSGKANGKEGSHHSFSLMKLPKEELRLNEYQPQVDQMVDYLSVVEIKEIESVVTRYMTAYQQVPYRAQLQQFNEDRPGFQIMEMFGTMIRRYAAYARMLENFTSLPNCDQKALLKGGVLEMCILRGALLFDPTSNRWPKADNSIYKNTPSLKLDSITHLTSSLIFRKHLEFIGFIQKLHLDEPCIMLLVLIVLFNKRPDLLRPERVEKCQAYYISLLERYMDWRFGALRSRSMFNSLMSKMNDLKDLSDTHNVENMRLGKDEFSSIQQQLQHLKINPYTKMKIIEDEGSDVSTCQESMRLQTSPSVTCSQPPALLGNAMIHSGMQLAINNQHSTYYLPEATIKSEVHELSNEWCCETSQQQLFNWPDQFTRQTEVFAPDSATPESFQHSPESASSFQSTPSSDSSSLDGSTENPSPIAQAYTTSQVSFSGFKSKLSHAGFDQPQLKLTELDCKIEGAIEAGDLVQKLDASAGVSAGQLSTSSVTGGLRFSQQASADWLGDGGGESTAVGAISDAAAAESDLTSPPFSAMEELFSDLERYSVLHHYY